MSLVPCRAAPTLLKRMIPSCPGTPDGCPGCRCRSRRTVDDVALGRAEMPPITVCSAPLIVCDADVVRRESGSPVAFVPTRLRRDDVGRARRRRAEPSIRIPWSRRSRRRGCRAESPCSCAAAGDDDALVVLRHALADSRPSYSCRRSSASMALLAGRRTTIPATSADEARRCTFLDDQEDPVAEAAVIAEAADRRAVRTRREHEAVAADRLPAVNA